jgi:hypothetical protein
MDQEEEVVEAPPIARAPEQPWHRLASRPGEQGNTGRSTTDPAAAPVSG